LRCKDGKLVSSRSDRLIGALPAAQLFEAHHSPKK
jgi:hypothetical protein